MKELITRTCFWFCYWGFWASMRLLRRCACATVVSQSTSVDCDCDYDCDCVIELWRSCSGWMGLCLYMTTAPRRIGWSIGL